MAGLLLGGTLPGVSVTAAAADRPVPAAPTETNDWSRDEFQFVFRFENSVTPPSRKSASSSQVYVYIPPAAKKVKALLLLQENVVEQMISVHPAIRGACDRHDVAIAWCTPGFDMVFTSHAAELHDLIQTQFRAFGRSIGYPELGDVPLITFGHSNTTAYAQNAAEAKPERVLAVLATHGWNGVGSLEHYRGPVLMDVGTFWEQKQQGLGNSANKGVASLGEVQKRLQRGWLPVSIVEEYGSGHFDYSEPVVAFYALFIEKAIEARLAPDGTLQELNPDDGYIAEVPAFPRGPIAIRRYADATPEQRRSSPWYFDRDVAKAAVKVIAGNGPWDRHTQLLGFLRPDGTLAPYSKSGPVNPVPYEIDPGTNRIRIYPTLLDAFPAEFKEAGQPIGRPPHPSFTLQYDCGPYLYRDAEGNCRIKLNRNGFGGYLAASTPGDANYRPAVQGTRLVLAGTSAAVAEKVRASANSEDGAVQLWPVGGAPLANPGDQKPGARVPLAPSRSATEYLGYFVDHGPARVVGDELEILPLPANTPGPVEVQLTAYRLTQTVEGLSSVSFHVQR